MLNADSSAYSSEKIAAALAAPFEEKDLKHRPGRAGMTFTYADARAVAQRLDDVLGIQGWEFEVSVADAARGVVKGTLHIVVDGKTVIHEDFGYPNSTQDDEPLKSAASDALRRCAAQVGVGRSLYSPEKGVPVPLGRVAPRSVAPTGTPEASSAMSADDQVMAAAAMMFVQGANDGACSHGEDWQLKPGGVSKVSGKPYNAFYAASHKTPDGGWCKDKPSQQWVAAQSAAPAKPKLVPEEDLSELPF
jgi:hypothetical protein